MSPGPVEIGANPYAQRVAEDAAGLRWVYTHAGWVGEDRVEPLMVCRASSPADVAIALDSLCVAPVAKAFGQNWKLAYAVWSAPRGQPVGKVAVDPERAAWFENQVLLRQADHGWQQWIGNAPLHWGRLRWEHIIKSSGSDGWPLGMMAGVRRRLASSRGEEWGLVQPGATWRLPGYTASPSRTSCPVAPDGKTVFAGRRNRSVPPGHVAVLWHSRSLGSAWGATPLHRWFDWWAEGGAGWWITDAPGGDLARAFASRLVAAKRACVRHVVKCANGQAIEAWHIGEGDKVGHTQVHTLEEWAGPAPVASVPVSGEQGNAPYLPASSLPPTDAWAPSGLVDAMREGVNALVARAGSVDTSVASLLSVPPQSLSEKLSAEQVDAVAMAAARLSEGRAFLLADETGFGKGRVIASLAMAGLAQGRTVLVLTERKQLFSDLYRDLCAVSGKPPVPLLFHAQADIKDASGKVVMVGARGKKYKQMLREHAWPDGADRLVFTTYGQLSHGSTKDKMAWLSERLGAGAWILLDESHNAAGESAVGENIEKLVSVAGGVVYASATFVRGEGNLAAYHRILPWGKASLQWIQSALRHDSGPLRQSLVEEIARSGMLLRREHPPIPPPAPVWIEPTVEQQASMECFVEMWQAMFAACEQWEAMQNGRMQLAWMRIGAVMARSVREFSLWMKAPALVDRIVQLRQEGRKIVVAVDSTMEAALIEAITSKPPSTEDGVDDVSEVVQSSGTGAPPLWRDRWRRLLDELVAPTPTLHPSLVEARGRVIQAIDRLPEWSLSPLDWVRSQVVARGVSISEISGRNTRLEVSEEGWKVAPRASENRNDTVLAFNSGQIDCLLLTRAAASGISLHAGVGFKDQSQRVLIEWGIAADPLVRVQFWGRVRRRDQVCEPAFESLSFDQPAERRLRERDEKKRRQLSSHLGKTAGGELDLLSPLGEALVEEWAAEHTAQARRLGVMFPVQGDPIGRVDRVLARSLVLPDREREALICRLDRGVEQGAQFWAARAEPPQVSSRRVRSRWWWGDPDALCERRDGVWPWVAEAVERSWLPRLNVGSQQAAQVLRDSDAFDGPQAMERWKKACQHGGTSSAVKQNQMRWAASILPSLRRGFAIQMTDPPSGHPVKAMVLDVDAPTQEDPLSWALSQVSVRVLRVGYDEVLRVPLSGLFKDPAFKTSGAPFKPAWFDAPMAAIPSIVIEGNPLAAAAWGRRAGMGWSQKIHDESGDERLVWRLPSHISWARLASMPRDLLAVEQVFEFWRQHDDQPVYAAMPPGQDCQAIPVAGAVLLRFSPAGYDACNAQWLDIALSKALSPARRSREGDHVVITRSVPWKGARRWFEMATVRGLGWRVSSQYAAWHETSCRNWFKRRFR